MTQNCSSPLVSILIAAYKSEAHIDACIVSAIGQSYRNIEVIVVNDGSPDNLSAIAQKYADKDPRVIVINKPKNEGLVMARKTGIEAAKGKYIQYLDSDDTLCDGVIEILVDKAEQSNADIVAAPFVMVYDGVVVDIRPMLDFDEMSGVEFLNAILNHKAFWSVWSKFHLRSLYTNHIERPNISMGEDIILTTQLLWYSKKIVRIAEPIVNYNFSEVSSMSHPANFSKKKYLDMRRYIAWLDNFIEKHNLNEICDRGMACFHVEHSTRILSAHPFDGHRDIGKVLVAMERYPELSEMASFKYNKAISRYKKSRLYGLLTALYYKFTHKF